ncbi:MAG: imidazole glycerol phosphate synthase subunit HisH [Synergistaceae bacterium]|nr:imidazole glycerol phosphate synthase subunit HisH [Synergistaceae bacterium]
MLGVIDYGAGNLRSVVNALEFLQVQNKIVSNINEIKACSSLILPGVGAFGAALDELEKRGLKEIVAEAAAEKPFLGICLGMQLLFEESEEAPGRKGLGVLKGCVRRFPSGMGLKIPHMGWNSLSINSSSKLFADTPQNSYVYFVHSFYCSAEERSDVAAVCSYGLAFDAAVEKKNLFGCQFHPEKSGNTGLALLKKFVSLCGETE